MLTHVWQLCALVCSAQCSYYVCVSCPGVRVPSSVSETLFLSPKHQHPLRWSRGTVQRCDECRRPVEAYHW